MQFESQNFTFLHIWREFIVSKEVSDYVSLEILSNSVPGKGCRPIFRILLREFEA